MLLKKLVTRTLLPLLLTLSSSAWSDELSELRARNAQLEATVEELTLQLADALKERRRLEASLAEATASLAAAEANLSAAEVASSTSSARTTVSEDTPAGVTTGETEMVEEEIVSAAGAGAAAKAEAMTLASALDTSGCSVSEALAGYDGKRASNEALTDWLKSGNHMDVCTTEQLEEIRAAIKWDWLGYEKEAIRMLDKEIEARR